MSKPSTDEREALDTDVIRARAADLRAVRYDCECQVGGVDATSIDADYLHTIGVQIDALLDALAARPAVDVEGIARAVAAELNFMLTPETAGDIHHTERMADRITAAVVAYLAGEGRG